MEPKQAVDFMDRGRSMIKNLCVAAVKALSDYDINAFHQALGQLRTIIDQYDKGLQEIIPKPMPATTTNGTVLKEGAEKGVTE